MTALYDLTKELRDAQSLVLSGELTAEMLADTLQALEGEFEQKALSVGRFMLNLQPTVDGIDAEIRRLQDRKSAVKGKQERLKEYLRDNMVAAEISKIECDIFTITCKKASEIAVIDDERSIPDEHMNVKTVITANKTSIKKALKEGQDVPGAHLEMAKAPIVIK